MLVVVVAGTERARLQSPGRFGAFSSLVGSSQSVRVEVLRTRGALGVRGLAGRCSRSHDDSAACRVLQRSEVRGLLAGGRILVQGNWGPRARLLVVHQWGLSGEIGGLWGVVG